MIICLTGRKLWISNCEGNKNHSAIFPKKARQFIDNKEKESMESHNGLRPERTWNLKTVKVVYTFKLLKLNKKHSLFLTCCVLFPLQDLHWIWQRVCINIYIYILAHVPVYIYMYVCKYMSVLKEVFFSEQWRAIVGKWTLLKSKNKLCAVYIMCRTIKNPPLPFSNDFIRLMTH